MEGSPTNQRECRNAAVLAACTAAVEMWHNQMLGLVAYIALPKEKSKQRNGGRVQSQYVSTLRRSSDNEDIIQLRLNIMSVDLLCSLLRNRGLLQDTRHAKVEEQVALFLHIIAYHVKNKTNSVQLFSSGATISSDFQRVLTAVNALAPKIIKQAGIDSSHGWPYGFEGCLRAMDETHVPACVGPEVEFGSANYTQMSGDVQMGLDDLIYDFNTGEKSGEASSQNKRQRKRKRKMGFDDLIFDFDRGEKSGEASSRNKRQRKRKMKKEISELVAAVENKYGSLLAALDDLADTMKNPPQE